MKKLVVIINGNGGVGKDTLCEFAKDAFAIRNISAITPIKEIASRYGWKGEKDAKARKFLADLKVLTTEYNDMSFMSMSKKVAEFKEDDAEIMFLHIREPENIERAVNAFGAKTLLVKRVGLQNITSNFSDANVDNYDYDYRIENDTLEGLEFSALLFIEKLRGSYTKKHSI